jgi:hypothetical protein
LQQSQRFEQLLIALYISLALQLRPLRDFLSSTSSIINCAGVLHHLRSPLEGLRALAAVLEPSGGMSIGMYGVLGRTGVYAAQQAVRVLRLEQFTPDSAAADATGVAHAHAHPERQAVELEDRQAVTALVLNHLPERNWLRLNGEMLSAAYMDDAERRANGHHGSPVRPSLHRPRPRRPRRRRRRRRRRLRPGLPV